MKGTRVGRAGKYLFIFIHIACVRTPQSPYTLTAASHCNIFTNTAYQRLFSRFLFFLFLPFLFSFSLSLALSPSFRHTTTVNNLSSKNMGAIHFCENIIEEQSVRKKKLCLFSAHKSTLPFTAG